MKHRKSSTIALQPDREAYDVLRAEQWSFGKTNGNTVYELRLDLENTAIVTDEKGNAPAVGLPTLDGFLSYVAFRAALGNALQAHPDKAQSLIWQWNVALREATMWIDFSLPLREIAVQDMPSFFDCSVGLPTYSKDGQEYKMFVPSGALFADHMNLHTCPNVVDSIPLRRRVAEPFGRTITLKTKLEKGEGSNKALDNRLYFSLTTSYTFYFRGDKQGVKRLLTYAQRERIGIGKKTVLGYGLIKDFTINAAEHVNATCAKPILNNAQVSLIKSLPYDYIFRAKNTQDRKQKDLNKQLFGCEQFSLVAVIETLGAYRTPYWPRERRTQILRYGSIIQPKMSDEHST